MLEMSAGLAPEEAAELAPGEVVMLELPAGFAPEKAVELELSA